MVVDGDAEEETLIGCLEIGLLPFCGLDTSANGVYNEKALGGSLVCGDPVVGNSVGRLLPLRTESKEGVIVGCMEVGLLL